MSMMDAKAPSLLLPSTSPRYRRLFPMPATQQCKKAFSSQSPYGLPIDRAEGTEWTTTLIIRKLGGWSRDGQLKRSQNPRA